MLYAQRLMNALVLPLKKMDCRLQSSINLSRPIRVAIVFLLFGCLWILTTDWLVIKMAGDNPGLLHEIMSLKGIVFIFLSAVLIYKVDAVLSKKVELVAGKNEELVKHYQALNAASKEAIYEYDLQTHTMHVNNYLKDIFGLPGNNMQYSPATWQQIVHPDDHEKVSNGMRQQIAGRRHTWEDEYRMMDTSGQYRYIRHSSYLIVDNEGRPSYIIGALQDVSEMRKLQQIYFEEKIKNETQLMQAIVQAEEKERNRWAEELHDNIGQLLAVTKLYADSIKETTTPQKPVLDSMRSTLVTAITEIRQLSARLKPPVFADETLEEAVKGLAANINRVKNIRFSIHSKNFTDKDLKDEHKLMIYRIIQEQLCNITRYAEARHVRISMEKNNSSMTVTVKDDGKGFDTSAQSAGIGIKNIRSRLKAYKGNAEISSMPGHGCLLKATFNLV